MPNPQELIALAERVEALTEALTPSAATKAAYHGEFHFLIDDYVDGGVCERTREITVPWSTVKEIMAAIRARAQKETGK
jgi:hypothetical protein